MLIRLVDGKLMYDDIQSTEKTMEERIRIWETHEQGAKEMTAKIRQNVIQARNNIRVLKKLRADKEALIERNEFRYKTLEGQLKLAEERHDQALKDTRLDQLAKEKERKIRNEIKKLFVNQALYHKKILNGLLQTEILQKYLDNVFDKDMRLKERMASSLDRLRYQINLQDELKTSIRKKLANVKDMHGKVFELEPKIKASVSRVQSSSTLVTELTTKVKEMEDEIKKVQIERIRMIEQIERAAVECGQKQKRNQKGPPTIDALEKLLPKKTPIEIYKVKRPEAVKAFEKYTQLYTVY